MIVFETEEHELAVLLRGVNLLISKARQNELNHLGITPAYACVLHFTQKTEIPCTISELRQLIGMSNSSMVGVINRMERDGFIKRQPDNQNKKYTRILVTEEGRALYKKALELNAFTTIFSKLSREERQNLKKYLNSLEDMAQVVLAEQQNKKGKTRKREAVASL